MARSLSDLVREGLAQTLVDPCCDQALACAQAREPALDRLGWIEIVSLMHRRAVPAARQDEVLAAVIRSYRAGSGSTWAPLLLAMLAPALIGTAALVRTSTLEIDSEDVDQQAVFEVLRACAEMPLPDGCRYVQRRVLLLANKRLRRWAARERRHLSQVTGDLMEICK